MYLLPTYSASHFYHRGPSCRCYSVS